MTSVATPPTRPGATEDLAPRPTPPPPAPESPPQPTRLLRSRAVAVSLAAGAVTVAAARAVPTSTTELAWFVPAVDVLLIALLGLVAVLGCMDAVLRRHSRSIPIAAAACAAAVVWIPHLVVSPGVLPADVLAPDPDRTAALFYLAHLLTPTALALAMVVRTGPLARSARHAAVAMAVATTAALWLILVMVLAAPHLPASVVDGHYTLFSRTMVWFALVPIGAAIALHKRGHRGDERVFPALVAAMVLLACETVAEVIATGRYTTAWYLANLLRLSPGVVLLVGQLQLYARTVVQGLADQEALRASEAAHRASIEGLQEGVALSDLAGRVHMLNEAGRRLLGYTADELTAHFQSGRWVTYREDGSVLPPAERPLRHTMDTGTPMRDAIVGWRRKDGGFQLLRGSTEPIFDEAGQLTSVVTAFADVSAERADEHRRVQAETERQRAHEELAHANAELARSNADLEEFAAIAAHDLRTPLSTIAGFAELLREGVAGPIGPANEEYAEHIQVGVRRMQALVDDLLTYARVGQGTRRSRVDLGALVSEALDALRVEVEASHAQILVGDLPVIDADPVQVLQLLQNLLSNALKFHAPGTSPVVWVEVEDRPDGLVFAVRDNGIGIDPRFRDRVFKMFQRLHPSGQYAGTGIGLAVCRRVVENHGGAIWIDSADQGGTVVRFTLAPPRA